MQAWVTLAERLGGGLLDAEVCAEEVTAATGATGAAAGAAAAFLGTFGVASLAAALAGAALTLVGAAGAAPALPLLPSLEPFAGPGLPVLAPMAYERGAEKRDREGRAGVVRAC